MPPIGRPPKHRRFLLPVNVPVTSSAIPSLATPKPPVTYKTSVAPPRKPLPPPPVDIDDLYAPDIEEQPPSKVDEQLGIEPIELDEQRLMNLLVRFSIWISIQHPTYSEVRMTFPRV